MKFIEVVEDGQAKWGLPECVIETLHSKLFFFGQTVIKIYQHKSVFYGDMADFAFRKQFYAEDFYWNHAMSPDIYVALKGVRGSVFEDCHLEVAEDFYIEMQRVDTANVLTQLLETNAVTAENLGDLIRTMILDLRRIRQERTDVLAPLFARGHVGLHQEEWADLRSWMYLSPDIAKEETDHFIGVLEQEALREPYLMSQGNEGLSAAIDSNPDNLLLIDGRPGFIDIMTPKENWRVHDEFFGIVRVAVDVRVLGGEYLMEAVYDTSKLLDIWRSERTRLLYELRSALIQWPYRLILKQPERAKKYEDFARQKLKELTALDAET